MNFTIVCFFNLGSRGIGFRFCLVIMVYLRGIEIEMGLDGIYLVEGGRLLF